MKKTKLVFITIIVIFILSFLRGAPLFYKGYVPTGMYENLVLARNLAAYGVYKMEDNKNIVLASSQIMEKGVLSDLGNKLTIYLNALFFKIFGFKFLLPFYISIFMFAASGVLIFLLVLKIFNNYWLALSAFFLDLFMPFVWKGALTAGCYEFASVFFLFALLLFFNKTGEEKKKNLLIYILVGLFLGLASASRNAFLISAIAIIAYEFYRTKSWKIFLALFLPIVFILGATGLTDNAYLKSVNQSFSTYGHLFPDPYTYHFEKQNYLESIKNITNPDIVEYLVKYGYNPPIFKRIAMYGWSAYFYLKELFSLINFGGPIFLFLAVLGGIFLYREKRELFNFISWWLIAWYVLLVALKTNNWDHFLEIRFALILLISFGAWKLIEKKDFLFGGGLIIILSLQLLFSNKWLFHQDYEASFFPKAFSVIDAINSQKIGEEEAIAVNFHPASIFILNYYTDKNFIYFAPATIQKLIEQKKIDEVFQYFGVIKLISYKDYEIKK